MSLLDSVREKFGTPRDETDRTDKSPSGSFGGPQDRDSESFGVGFDLDTERSHRAIERREQARLERLEPVLALMRRYPGRHYSFATATEGDYVILSFVIVGEASAEFTIPKEKWDAFKLLEILEGLELVGEPPPPPPPLPPPKTSQCDYCDELGRTRGCARCVEYPHYKDWCKRNGLEPVEP